MDFASLVVPILQLFQRQITVFGITFSFWSLLVWMLLAGVLIDFVKGVFLDDE